MDNYAEPTPPKKTCISKNVDDVQLIECVPQQLSGTTKQTDSTTNWKFKNLEIFAKPSMPTSTSPGSQIVSNREYQVLNKSHKLETPSKLRQLRILSPKGRDLGQFNVEMRTNNPLKGKTVKIIKPVKKMPILSLPNKEPSLQIFKPITPKMPQINLVSNVDSTSCYKTVHKINKMNIVIPQQKHFVIMPKNITYDRVIEVDKDEQICKSDITYSEVDEASTSGTNLKNSVNQASNSKQNHSEINSVDNIKIQEVTTKNNKVSSAARIPIQTDGKTQFLLINSSHEQYKHLKIGKKECIAVIKRTKDGKIITSLKSAPKIDRNLNQDNSDSSNKKSFSNERVSGDQNNSLQITSKLGCTNNQVDEIKTQNVMTVIPNNEKLFIQNAASSANTKYTIVGENKNSQDTKSDNVQNKDVSKTKFRNACLNVTIDTCDSEIEQIADISTSVQSNLQDKTYRKDHCRDLSNQYNIIQRAVDSVKDNNLRALALKALTDCKIGFQRYIPVRSAVELKSVRDTQIQTEVFGLLEPSSFILIKKDIDNINRISQISLQDISGGQNLLSANDLCSYVDCTPNVPDACEQQNIFDVDNFLKHFEENLDVVKIKDTLSATMKKYRNLVDHLQKDFESVKQYDENGMLNIHNAVISNNTYLVQRQLMILKYCKESVDILTEDGLTSLELAIKYDVHSEIVKLLLEAGAQPVLQRYIHESALIIASKQSSPLLPVLINSISDLKLFDLTDSEGLAALHYCCIHGNLEGVNALLLAGANIDLKDGKSGRTPLFHAMDNDHTLVAQALLKAGAIVNIANYAGQTALPIMTETRCAPFRISMYTDTL